MRGEYKHEQQHRLDSNSQRESEIKPVPNPQCPRCDSMKTKFCYFNNYKTSQPRYVCKNCKRFWTHGGNVRNIPTKGEEKRMKCAMDCSPSGGNVEDFPSTALSPPQPPLTITSTSGNFYKARTLNLTRPKPTANQHQLKFVRVDNNSLSFIQGFNRVPNPYLASPQSQGQSNAVQPNHQVYQARYGQGYATQLIQSNNLSISSGDPSCLNTNIVFHYMEPNNTNIFGDNSDQIGHTRDGLSGSSSRTWFSY